MNPPRLHSGHARRTRHGVLVVLMVALMTAQYGSPLAFAQVETDEINAERAHLEELRQQQVEFAKFMDPLLTEDIELEERLTVLETNVARQQEHMTGIQLAISQAEGELHRANAQVGAKTLEILALKDSIRLQAVEAYLQPQDTGVTHFLTSADLTVAERRRALIDSVSQKEGDLLDALRGAETRLSDLVESAEAAVREVELQRDEEAAQLVEIQEALVAAEAARADLNERVLEVQSEIDGYADAELEVNAILNQLVAEEEARLAAVERQRREAERQRIEAERARVAALTAPPAQAAETGQPTQAVLAEPVPQGAPASSSLRMPVSGVITSSFGPRWGRMHEGVDIAANTGTTVFAAGGGTVVSAGANGGYGNMVLVNHGGGTATLYAHLSYIGVSVGSNVGQGEVIGQVGCTGNCTGAHLHFEVRIGGVAYDPMQYLG